MQLCREGDLGMPQACPGSHRRAEILMRYSPRGQEMLHNNMPPCFLPGQELRKGDIGQTAESGYL